MTHPHKPTSPFRFYTFIATIIAVAVVIALPAFK